MLIQVGAGKVEFVPNKDSDENGQFKFQVGDGEKFSKAEYETEIIVNAVADAPEMKISATSNEVDENGEITDSDTTTVSQNLGEDIDLSGLTSILEEQKTGDIDLSKNGSQDKLTLTLDDVLKLSGDDGKIKITGDQFDSVSFKDTIDKNGQAQTWSKNAGTGEDEGFDIYVNSGDESLKVKVEQPISDGITN